MQIEIEDSMIEDLISKAIDDVDITSGVDVEVLIANELQEQDLLKGINVKDLVKSAIRDAVENSDDFDAFMKMRDSLEKVELEAMDLRIKYGMLLKMVTTQDDEINALRYVVRTVELAQSRPWYKFWN
jgi:hypothetical protein